jgi:hypothetical protein
VHDRHQPRAGVELDGVEQALVRDVPPPLLCDLDHARALARGDLGDAGAEVARHAHDHGVARLDQVHDAGLHAGGPRALQGQHHAVRRAVDLAQHRHDLVEDRVEGRIEVPEHRLAHRRERGRLDVRGARAAEQALGRGKRGDRFGHGGSVPRRDPSFQLIYADLP